MARPRRSVQSDQRTSLDVVSDVIDALDEVDVVEASTVPTQRATELMRRWLDLKKATSLGNIHQVNVLIYDLLSLTSDRSGWLYDGADVKKILLLFGFAADFAVDAAEEARDQIAGVI